MKVRQVVVIFRQPILFKGELRERLDVIAATWTWTNGFGWQFVTPAGDEVMIPMDSIGWVEVGAATEQPG